MSKTKQREQSRKDYKQKQFEKGAEKAKFQMRNGYVDYWCPRCMAWRAGFLRAGGKVFW